MTREMIVVKYLRLLALAVVVAFAGCVSVSGNGSSALSLWNDDAPAKAALLEYVGSVTKKGAANYIPPENRIAVFDFDGTLFCETDPTYFDWSLFEYRVLDDPAYRATEEQLSAARASREKGVMPELTPERERMVADAYRGLALDGFAAYVRNFMNQPQPGFSGMKRGEAFYRPMVEVVRLLLENDFKVYVCSGTDRLTMRPVVEDGLSLPPQWIIGSDSTIVAREQGERDGLGYIYQKTDELTLGGKSLVKNLQMNKVSVIAQEIGIQPVLAFGNSSSDASMINYAIANRRYRGLGFMLLCDDMEREYGNLVKADKMRSACESNGWIPVSMKNDWKTIYGDGVVRKSRP